MKKQNQIKITLSKPENIKRINELQQTQAFKNRTQLAKTICEKFNFVDLKGDLQESSCVTALKQLEKQKYITLPPISNKSTKVRKLRTLCRLETAVEPPINVPKKAGDVQGLELILVEDKQQLKIWNELMISEHPIKTANLVGRQLRYLIHSKHGYLGGFGFASAALTMSDREKWIGWDKNQRDSYLQYVLNMTRFLIRPSVKCKNLASMTLAMSMSRISEDFYSKYQCKLLLLESFVDTELYTGSCYKAANWIEIGKTKGRGRGDEKNLYSLSIKSIYMYPLEKEFRQKMGIKRPEIMDRKIDITDNIDSDSWAHYEFNQAPVGNSAITKRLVHVATTQSHNPSESYSHAVNGDWKQTKAYYRMIDKPDDSAFSMENILKPHKTRTINRIKSQNIALCLQDDCEINYSTLNNCEGLGFLKSNQTGAKMMGIVLTSTFCVTTNGLPLGILKAQCHMPKEKTKKETRKPHTIPIEEKKTYSWVDHHRNLVKISKQVPETQIVHVCDREADFYELFEEQQKDPRVDLLIRVRHNRNIPQEPNKLFDYIGESQVMGYTTIAIPAKSSRLKKSKQKASEYRLARNAKLAIRSKIMQIPAPSYYPNKKPITLTIIYALEEKPPKQAKPIAWYLLTTMSVESTSDAMTYLNWYAKRWRIEDFHRVLKSGCKIDKLKLKSATRLSRAIAINMVIGWRIMLMTLLGREMPNLSANVLFTDFELFTLNEIAKKKLENTN